MERSRILLIEDEENISSSLSIILVEEGFDVEICDTGKAGLESFDNSDLMVLDLMLPDMNGLDILKQVRSKSQTYPVLIVSARDTEQDLITGLEYGADDYITKPFSTSELILRIRRALTRKKLFAENLIRNNTLKKYTFGDGNFINFEILTAVTPRGEISLTSQEAEILLYLIERQTKIVSRTELIKHIWGRDSDYESRTVDNFMVRFRKYFEINPKKPIHFVTKRGVGYIFNS